MPITDKSLRVRSRPVFAWVYRHLARRMERGPVGRYRRELLSPMSGRVLEIGVGTGENLKHYSPLVERITAIDPDRFMLRHAIERADARQKHQIDFIRAAGERLPFRSESFDAAVTTLVLCSVSDQLAVLEEIGRVLRPDGTLYFLEHVLDENSPRIARRQQRWSRVWSAFGAGCHPDRITAAVIEQAGFEMVELRSFSMSGAPKIVRPHILGEARKSS